MFLTVIHTVLHPCHKLEYFKRNDWDDMSIDAAHNIVQDEFDRSYWLLDVEGDKDTTQGNRTIIVSCSFSNMFLLTMLNTGFDISQPKKHV